ncbi:MYG1 exonuclease [Alligator mississippiensis]|uniref:MYG1 exonuclease n=1 Tax=Alligator mississippiensis TaxID=8496 RepID=UPI0028778C55|nr:MYG1 exonuclease [Alligator mississippiensis]
MGTGFRAARSLLRHMASPAPGRAPRLGTHDGNFHCDEALACTLLRVLPRYRDAEIVRTREPQLLAQCDVVVDVGGEYDPQRHRYDHHQRSFSQSMHDLRPDKPWTTKLSSAGLVYLHFGSQILAHLLGRAEDDPVVQLLYDKLYENFMEEIDAIDNGVAQLDGKPRYAVTTDLSARVGLLNPRWNDPNQDTETQFQKAMELVKAEFLDRLDYYHRAWLPARTLVEDAVQKRFEVDPSGEILVLPSGGCPWKEHLFSLEAELGVETPIKFVLYPDQNGRWRVQSVPATLHSFHSRLPLLEAWRGLRDQELSQLSGIPGCIFVHTSGFIGGNQTQEGALLMAQKTLTPDLQGS